MDKLKVSEVFKSVPHGLINSLNESKVNNEFNDGVTPYDFVCDVLRSYDADQERIKELEAQQQWISVESPINGSYDWEVGDKAIGWDGYAFEIEWDGDCWCNIGGEVPTHWMPLPKPPEE